MLRSCVAIGLAFLAACHAAGAAETKAEQLARKAAELAVPADAEWKRYILEPETVDDAALNALLVLCEKAVDLYQESLEEAESGAVNNAILTLARRIARLRFEMIRRERARTPAPEPEKPPAANPPPVAPPEPPPTTAPEAPPASTTTEAPAALPEIVEDAKATRMGIQALRNFLMHDYFASRKWTSLVVRCPLCEGTGRRKTGRLTKDKKIETTACTSCGETGFHLNDAVARKGYWLCKSPLYRADGERVAAWEKDLEAWRRDPRTVSEFLDRVSIEGIDYHGLWAKITLAERGHVREPTEPGKPPRERRFDRKREYTMVRIGRRWFFYDAAIDAGLFRDGE